MQVRSSGYDGSHPSRSSSLAGAGAGGAVAMGVGVADGSIAGAIEVEGTSGGETTAS